MPADCLTTMPLTKIREHFCLALFLGCLSLLAFYWLASYLLPQQSSFQLLLPAPRLDRNYAFSSAGKVYLQTRGRLGNILYQYAMLLSVRHITGKRVYLVSETDLIDIFRNITIPILKHSWGLDAKIKSLPTLSEHRPGGFMPNFTNNLSHGDILLCCYFQSQKYFNGILDTVKKEFTFKENIQTAVQTILHRARLDILGDNGTHPVRFIGIHARRGDLKRKRSYDTGYRMASVSYFLKAKSFFKKRFQERLLFVVTTDDKHWVQEHLSGSDTYISQQTSAVADMALLAACNDTIMSVGTYGWWAGFLAGGLKIYYTEYKAKNSAADEKFSTEDKYCTPDWIPMGD